MDKDRKLQPGQYTRAVFRLFSKMHDRADTVYVTGGTDLAEFGEMHGISDDMHTFCFKTLRSADNLVVLQIVARSFEATPDRVIQTEALVTDERVVAEFFDKHPEVFLRVAAGFLWNMDAKTLPSTSFGFATIQDFTKTF